MVKLAARRVGDSAVETRRLEDAVVRGAAVLTCATIPRNACVARCIVFVLGANEWCVLSLSVDGHVAVSGKAPYVAGEGKGGTRVRSKDQCLTTKNEKGRARAHEEVRACVNQDHRIGWRV